MFIPTAFFDRIRWLPVYNNGSTAIPAFGVCVVDSPNGSFRENQYMIPVRQYGGFGQAGNAVQLMVCGPQQISPATWGVATFDSPAYVLYDPSFGAPLPGKEWGPSVGSYKLRTNRPGFTIIGGTVTNGGSGTERVMARWDWPPVLFGKTDAAVNKGSSGIVSIWTGQFPGETDTGQDVGAVNRFANVGAGKWVACAWSNSNWHLIAAEC